MVGEYISLLLKQIGAPTTPAFSHPSFPEGGEAIRRKPFGKKGKKGREGKETTETIETTEETEATKK
ncbi:MAG: hypothetical protein E7G03_01920 [Bacteroides caccae]|nr:hypothetical protein [Bacteroides caccae]MDU3627803.1 hypothetical protein [Bacteroides caccae]MDU3669142.1 hypothetical protein [Bacteroides caccae]